tara:strand:- start:9751 stop:9978 length:228 start_codon:yes stop_codon:yes gene_type:complete
MLNEINITGIESTMRALVIFSNGEYQITSVVVPMLKSKDGSFRPAYPDHYFFGDRCFYFHKIDRKNKTITLKERV